MKTLIIALALVAVALPAAAQERVRIYMQPPTAVEGFVDETSKGQRDTFTDLREQLAKKKTLELVESPAQADVTLSILDRDNAADTGKTITDTVRAPTGLLSSTGKVTMRSVTVTLTSGDYNRELTASHEGMFVWKYLAGKLAGQVEKWVKDNASTIVAKR